MNYYKHRKSNLGNQNSEIRILYSVTCHLNQVKNNDNMPVDLSYIKRFVDLSIVEPRTFKDPN